MKLIGHAFNTGRIDFTRELNPWAFQRIDAGMKKSQRDRILVDPTQAKIELHSAPVNDGVVPEWMGEMEQFLQCADSVYLQFKSEVLRFRNANLDAGKKRTFVAIGSAAEFDQYAAENWSRIRYFYAERRISAFCFDVTTLITHRHDAEPMPNRMELELRMDLQHFSGQPQLVFDATGSSAPLEIIEWRGTVKEGEIGRFSPKDADIILGVRNVSRPFTFLHEDREEFKSHSYTFYGEKTQKLLERVLEKRIKQLAAEAASEAS